MQNRGRTRGPARVAQAPRPILPSPGSAFPFTLVARFRRLHSSRPSISPPSPSSSKSSSTSSSSVSSSVKCWSSTAAAAKSIDQIDLCFTPLGRARWPCPVSRVASVEKEGRLFASFELVRSRSFFRRCVPRSCLSGTGGGMSAMSPLGMRWREDVEARVGGVVESRRNRDDRMATIELGIVKRRMREEDAVLEELAVETATGS
ncbi:hypothetical protein AAT19DRAFT_11782 [Rhodotorula toruloides]|uniref:Uncharacterized protein n=1 Tax=Rhodotorula toruloides TaxID=5286 RepID=A0A2S9ZVI4_RHOTO|nr:hypothetical protein AAT19DRAFT_11782 [Rhodotorula toruloides]